MRTRRKLLLAAFGAGLGLAGCPQLAPFVCDDDGDCRRDGVPGSCIAAFGCAYPDAECASMLRFSPRASSRPGECVPVDSADAGEDTNTDTGTGTSGGEPCPTGCIDLGSASDLDDSGISSEGTGAADGRVTDGLLALYRFDLTEGLVVPDLSGVAPAMPMSVMQIGGSPVPTSEGLVFDGGGIALVDGPADKVRDAIQASGALSAEVWSTAAERVQEGPPRLLTLSKTAALRSFSILHGGGWDARGVNDGDEFGFRIYAEGSTSANGGPTAVANAVITLSPMHWIATRTGEGLVELWADGVLVATYDIPGSLGVWATDDVLAVGNELTVDMPYRGTVHLAAVYDRALSEDEVAQNHAAGFLSP